MEKAQNTLKSPGFCKGDLLFHMVFLQLRERFLSGMLFSFFWNGRFPPQVLLLLAIHLLQIRGCAPVLFPEGFYTPVCLARRAVQIPAAGF